MRILRPGFGVLRPAYEEPAAGVSVPLPHFHRWSLPRPPDGPFELNTASPQAQGLVGWWPTLGSVGNVLRAYASTADAPITNATWGYTHHGRALVIDADAETAVVTTPSACPVNPHVGTLMQWCIFDTAAAHLMMSFAARAGGNNRIYLTRTSGTDNITAAIGQLQNIALATVTVGDLVVPFLTWDNGNYQVGINGVVTAADVYTDFAQAPTDMEIGNYSAVGNYAARARIHETRIYNRVLSAAELWATCQNPWDLCRSVMRQWTGFTPPTTEHRTVPLPHFHRWSLPRPPEGLFELNDRSPQAKGLVAWWPTLGSQGNVLRDYGPLRMNGTVSGATLVRDARIGGMLSYNGSSDVVTLVDSPQFDVPTFTIMAWFRRMSFDADHTILAKGGSDEKTFNLYIVADDRIRLFWEEADGTNHDTYSTGTITDSGLHQVVAVYDGAQNHIYIDGEWDISENEVATPAVNAKPAYIGANLGEAPQFYRYFEGYIGPVLFGGRPWSAAEVWLSYQNPWDLCRPVMRQWTGFTPPSTEHRTVPLPHFHRWSLPRPPDGQFELNRDSPQSVGLMGWWPTLRWPHRDLITGTETTLNGPPAYGPKLELGPVFDFNAGASHSIYLDRSVIKGRTTFTVSLWFKSDSTNVGMLFWEGESLGNGWGNHQEFHLYIGQCNSGTAWTPAANGIGACMIDGSISLTTEVLHVEDTTFTDTTRPHHVCATVHGGTVIRLYLDGVLVGTDTADNAPATTLYDTNARLGRPGPSERYFDGQIGDVRVCDRALSAGEVWSLYASKTRWDLCRPVTRQRVGYTPAVGLIMALFMQYYRRRRVT